MKRKLKVDLNELDVALNWSMSEFSHYLDLETGKVIGIDDEMRCRSEELLDEVDADEGDVFAAFEGLLGQREDIQEWEKELLLDAAHVEYDSAGRYIAIEPDEPYQDYNDMDRFIATLDDEKLQERLWDAIRGRGAFGRFRDLVARYPSVEERWYAYKDARAKARLLRWLEDHDIESIE